MTWRTEMQMTEKNWSKVPFQWNGQFKNMIFKNPKKERESVGTWTQASSINSGFLHWEPPSKTTWAASGMLSPVGCPWKSTDSWTACVKKELNTQTVGCSKPSKLMNSLSMQNQVIPLMKNWLVRVRCQGWSQPGRVTGFEFLYLEI